VVRVSSGPYVARAWRCGPRSPRSGCRLGRRSRQVCRGSATRRTAFSPAGGHLHSHTHDESIEWSCAHGVPRYGSRFSRGLCVAAPWTSCDALGAARIKGVSAAPVVLPADALETLVRHSRRGGARGADSLSRRRAGRVDGRKRSDRNRLRPALRVPRVLRSFGTTRGHFKQAEDHAAAAPLRARRYGRRYRPFRAVLWWTVISPTKEKRHPEPLPPRGAKSAWG
jgi:hypothetical protein